MKINQKTFLASVLLMAMANTAFAAAGIAGVTALFTNVSALMTGLALTVITVAFLYVGYQVAFGGKRIADMFPIIIGAVIIGAAGQFAAFLIP